MMIQVKLSISVIHLLTRTYEAQLLVNDYWTTISFPFSSQQNFCFGTRESSLIALSESAL